jgi:hypothetical protein
MSRELKLAAAAFEKISAAPSAVNVERIALALEKDDSEALRDALDKFKGSYAVECFIQAMLEFASDHKHNLKSVQKLLK